MERYHKDCFGCYRHEWVILKPDKAKKGRITKISKNNLNKPKPIQYTHTTAHTQTHSHMPTHKQTYRHRHTHKHTDTDTNTNTQTVTHAHTHRSRDKLTDEVTWQQLVTAERAGNKHTAVLSSFSSCITLLLGNDLKQNQFFHRIVLTAVQCLQLTQHTAQSEALRLQSPPARKS